MDVALKINHANEDEPMTQYFRKCKSLLSRVVAFMAVLLMITVGVAPAFAREGKAGKNVRVGYIDYENFINQDESGIYTGYGVDYLNRIAAITGWKIEYVFDSWSNHLENLKNGTIDFVLQAQKTEEREKTYLFSDDSIGSESSILYVGENDERYYYNDYESFNGMKIAVLENSFQNEEFRNYAAKKGFSYTEIPYASLDECFRALDAGTVDGVAIGSLAMRKGYRSVCKFGSDPFYAMSGTGNTELMSEMNDALEEIKGNTPEFETNLFARYYHSANDILSFTREESAFIKQQKTIKVGFIPNRAPFSSVDSSGKIDGIVKEMMDLISSKTGLIFQYEMMGTGVTAMEYLKENPTALATGIMTDNPNFGKDAYIVSDMFYKDDVVLACKNTMSYNIDAGPESYVLAIPRSYSALASYVEANYPQFKLLFGGSMEDCAKMVERGEADFFAQNVNVIKPLLQNPHYENLVILPSFFMNEPSGIAVLRTNENTLILSIINKAIATITEQEIDQMTVNQTLNNGYTLSFGDYVYKFRVPLLVIVALVLLCFFLLLTVSVNRQKNARQTAIANENLEKAVAKAERANVAKSQFLAQMSHEIRTPMNAIIGLTSIANAEADSPQKTREYLANIDGSSRLLLGIINDVLDMSAIEGGKLKIDNAPFNFKQMLTNLTTVFYQQAQLKNLTFQVRMNGVTEETIIGDELRVNQVLMNFLSNAIKFTPSGGSVDLTVLQASRSQDKVQMRFSVSDTGCGMSEDMMDRLFQPFEQESALTARKHGGSGLGLSIAKNLVEMMGGSIKVESTLHKGSVFTADIPFGVSEEGYPTDATGFADIHTLVVDDDKESCEYSSILLERLGVRYQYVTTGEAALDALGEAEDQGDPYKLCLVDWKMPDMDGIEATQRIREIYGNDTIVIIVSAYDLNEVEASGKAAGANYFIPKPLFQSTLFNALMRISGGDYTPINAENEKNDYDFSAKKVLVVEDVALNMEVAIKLLQLVGIETTCAEDGRQALTMFQSSKPGDYDAIFMDINMPVMDGYEATKAIRALERPDAKTIPIYAMTANAFSEDVTAALNAGMNGHIAKPIETKVLYRTLETLFSAGKQ